MVPGAGQGWLARVAHVLGLGVSGTYALSYAAQHAVIVSVVCSGGILMGADGLECFLYERMVGTGEAFRTALSCTSSARVCISLSLGVPFCIGLSALCSRLCCSLRVVHQLIDSSLTVCTRTTA